MTKLNERHHAFISAAFYRELKAGNFDNYEQAFLLATRKYAEQRGSRMAQRAIRDGRPLDFASYRWYGEWVYSDEYLRGLDKEKSRPVDDGDNLTVDIFDCPWSAQYLDMGLKDGANTYCSVLDESIARGFNPRLTFIVSHTMHDCGDYCRQTQVDANKGGEEAYGPRKPDNIRDFDYHCGHVYSTFAKTIKAIYGAVGETLAAKVLLAFRKEYGNNAADILITQLETDFDYI